MKLKEMVEIINQQHPEIGTIEAMKLLNRAQDEFSARTKILESADKFDIVANQRGYKLADHILEIRSVDYDGKTISRLAGRPKHRDLT
tara:strand:- start:1737 stop:2000 length:264 start_codon:yes stop_codon:yes gene_type:complete